MRYIISDCHLGHNAVSNSLEQQAKKVQELEDMFV